MSKTTDNRSKSYIALCKRLTNADLPVPLRERHARPLYRLLETDQPTVWRQALEIAPVEIITPYQVDRAVTAFLSEKLKTLLRRPHLWSDNNE